jgi:hypothetical protein
MTIPTQRLTDVTIVTTTHLFLTAPLYTLKAQSTMHAKTALTINWWMNLDPPNRLTKEVRGKERIETQRGP